MFGRKKPEILVVGAGPVGLFTALVLAKKGIRVQVVDKEWRPATHSYALALHAQTLRLLDEVDLLGRIVDQAYRIRTVGLFDGESRRAQMNLSSLDEDFSFLAVMRQDALEGALEEALKKHGVDVLWNHQVSQLMQEEDHVDVTIDKLDKESLGYAVAHSEWTISKTKELTVPFVIGSDGHKSMVRRSMKIGFPEVGEAQHFAVYEFKSDAYLQHEMRLVLHPSSTNVLWPLPEGHCRWSFQLQNFTAPAATRSKDSFLIELGESRFPVLSEDNLHTLIAERAPWFKGSVDEIYWRLVVRFEQRLADAFGKHRLWLAGDAAHITGPVGIQSMNVGLREGYELATILAQILKGETSMTALEDYNRQRRAEWQYLLGITGRLEETEETDLWLAPYVDRLLPCIPATGEDFVQLTRQLGVACTGQIPYGVMA